MGFEKYLLLIIEKKEFKNPFFEEKETKKKPFESSARSNTMPVRRNMRMAVARANKNQLAGKAQTKEAFKAKKKKEEELSATGMLVGLFLGFLLVGGPLLSFIGQWMSRNKMW